MNIINIFRKKQLIDGKKIPLSHVHTFKTGDKLYTYDQQHYGRISSRYYRAINEQLNYINLYNIDKSNVNASRDIIQEKCKEITQGGDAYTLAMDIYSIIEFEKSIPLNKTSAQLKFQEVLFCMFFLLEEEIVGGYNEAINKKKLDLLFSEDEDTKDAFFLSVNDILKNLDIQLEIDTVEMGNLLTKYLPKVQ